ncbi:MAG: U32 family peptidase [Clostridia bacterium]|nr:U32 family peptidase [Clostridia bacterium]
MELLAPAGSIPALKYAVAYGADAVYLGLGVLNARAKSTDFTAENLPEWVAYCHGYGVKVYVTVNTMVYQEELSAMKALVRCIDNAGADAIIAADPATVRFAASLGLPVHISTQAGVLNADAAHFWQKLGAVRVVLAREYRPDQIAAIRALGLEVEVFVQGALCVGFSGGCLLSSYIGGTSGNRGRCRQPCRQLYTAKNEHGQTVKEGYLLSTKDLCCQPMLSNLAACGVDSLKIEGRLRRPEYVAVAVDYYRRLLMGETPTRRALERTYNRGGYTTGYQDKSSVIYPVVPSHIGVSVGKIERTLVRGGYPYAVVSSSHAFTKGDGVKILRNRQEVGGADVTSVKVVAPGRYEIPVSAGAQVGDELRLTTDAGLIASLVDKRRIPCTLSLRMQKGLPVTLVAKAEDKTVEILGAIPQGERDLDVATIRAQLSKTGNTPFVATGVEVDYQGGYLPKSALNGLRTQALEQLWQKLTERQPVRLKPFVSSQPLQGNYLRCVREVATPADFAKSAEGYVLAPSSMDTATLDTLLSALPDGAMAFLKMPRIVRPAHAYLYAYAAAHALGLYADNVAAVEVARGLALPYIAGLGLNVANHEAVACYADASCILLSPEIGQDPSVQACGSVWRGGYLPLMSWEHCPMQVCYGQSCKDCTHRGEALTYHSKGEDFRIQYVWAGGCHYSLATQNSLCVPYEAKGSYYGLSRGEEPIVYKRRAE